MGLFSVSGKLPFRLEFHFGWNLSLLRWSWWCLTEGRGRPVTAVRVLCPALSPKVDGSLGRWRMAFCDRSGTLSEAFLDRLCLCLILMALGVEVRCNLNILLYYYYLVSFESVVLLSITCAWTGNFQLLKQMEGHGEILGLEKWLRDVWITAEWSEFNTRMFSGSSERQEGSNYSHFLSAL